MKYKLIGSHPEDLEDGRTVAPGEVFEMETGPKEHPHNQRLLDEDLVLKIHDKKNAGGDE